MQNRTNGVSVGGMVIGIVSLLLSFIPCVGILGGALAVVGLILSLIGYRSAKDQGGPTTMGIVGMVLSAIAIIVAIAWGTLIAKASSDISEPLNVESCDELLEEMEKETKQMNDIKELGEDADLSVLSTVMKSTQRIIKIQNTAREMECDQDSTFKAKMAALTEQN